MTEHMVNVPVPAFTKGAAIRQMITQHWLPALHAHRPELIFISAGFDAHLDDDMGQLSMLEEDYVWVTKEIKKIAMLYCDGKIVSCLEGGYNLHALAKSVEAHIRVLADLS